jgi:anti-sigma factor RsiW
LDAYALGQLDAHERAAVAAHLDGCTDCRGELVPLEALVPPLSRLDPGALATAPAPPPELGEQILQRVRTERRTSGRRFAAGRRRVPVLAAAAVATVALAGAAGALVGRGLGSGGEPVEPVAAVVAPALQANIGVIAHTWGLEVRLTGRGFAEGAPFRATVIDRVGRVVGDGSFVGTGPDETEYHLIAQVVRPDAERVVIADAAGREVVVAGL